jgi:RNA polymerase sigma factor (sigma-70 family)
MDRALLVGFRGGEREALERVYWEHVAGIEALVVAALRGSSGFCSADLADVVQEVFAKAFSAKARAAYDGERDYGPFLRQLARNTLVDWLRRTRRDVVHRVDVDGLALDDEPSIEGDAGMFPEDVLAVAQRFVVGLEPDLKAVHERRFLAGESQQRAAQALGISRQNLRTLETRLLTGLRRALRGAERNEHPIAFPQPTARPKPY